MAKRIMIQGTMSGVGKSLLCAGLCRIFMQDGYRTAPFKSQNMALNSYITKEGLEMGRAQVMQAEAAGIEPAVQMNPVLLKPVSDAGSQVIVHGEVIGNMTAGEYYACKRQLIPEILASYRELEEAYDIIVIEGAGSPAELNLKQDDIVNMGLAKQVGAPVLLVGDIDRGGVFAQLIGTCQLLDADEQQLIKGLVVNKFRGDLAIFAPGISILEEKSAIPVTGVVPYMDVDLEDEDSLTKRLTTSGQMSKDGLDIAVIRLPRIANFTDFNVLEQLDGVGLRYVSRAEQLADPDLIILPGTKNTIEDLLFIRQNGLESVIRKAADKGTMILGICGGYQMLGEVLEDPEGVESSRCTSGMALLPVRTRFVRQKHRLQVVKPLEGITGMLKPLNGSTVEGYEIHNGQTVSVDDPEAALPDLYGCGNVYGTYIHGFFDRAEVRGRMLDVLAQRKGLSHWQSSRQSYQQYKEEQYDRLAAQLRCSLDMEQVYRILEEGV